LRTDVHGCSICPPGEERWEAFTAPAVWGPKQTRVQYDYRTPDGKLFSCVAPSLEAARARRDEWLGADTRRDAQ
jgi:hypothetical protein